MHCARCAAGPSSIDGHRGIALNNALPHLGGEAVFRCLDCGQHYLRRYEGSGLFIWIPIELPSGDTARPNAVIE